MALALSARGVRIVVTGREEKALGVTVGEVVHGGGKARHLAGEPRDPSHVAAALDRAIEVFGGIDFLLIAEPMLADCMLELALPRMRSPGRVLFAGVDAADPAVARLASEGARDFATRGVTCNVVVLSADDADIAESAAELAVYLCSRAGGAIAGQTIEVGHAVRGRSRS